MGLSWYRTAFLFSLGMGVGFVRGRSGLGWLSVPFLPF